MSAATQPSMAMSVLLSVKSRPNGNPVHQAPKANFWTKGPRMKPPTKSRAAVHRANLRALFLRIRAAMPAQVEKSIAVNITST